MRGRPSGAAGLDSELAQDLANYLVDQAGQLRLVIEASHDMISLNRLDTTFIYVSRACQDILGYAPDELIGRRARDLTHPEDVAVTLAARQRLLAGVAMVAEYRMIRKDGEPVWVEASARPPVPGADTVAVVTREVSERHELQELLMTAALHDPVTGLPNRRCFDDRLAEEIARAGRRETTLAVLFIDLDNFKLLNDRLGHKAGDRVLREAGQRISHHIRVGDIAARYGGDEFLVACVDLHSPAEAAMTAARIEAALALPYAGDDLEHAVTGSIGIAVWHTGMTPEELVDEADRAMYAVKNRAIKLPEPRRPE